MLRLRKMRWLVALVGLGLSSCAALAQKPKPEDYGIKSKKALDYFLQARQQQEYRDYVRAYESYHLAIELEPQFAEAWFSAGSCQYVLHDYPKAMKELENARKYWQEPHPSLHFYLGETYFYLNKFPEAKKELEAFVGTNVATNPNMRATAERHVVNARFGADHFADSIRFKPINMGESVNTQFDEYLPYLTADEQTIFFTSRRPESTGGYNSEYRDYTEDFFFCNLKNAQWEMASNLGPPVNTELNEGAATFSPDGQWVYFTACSRPGGIGDCDIYVSKLEGTKWSEPQNLGPAVNSGSWDSQPCISNDGNTLFFSSNRKGGLGQHDIWFTERVNGRWTEAKPLGAPINTPGSEFSPFLHADGQTLYFSSNGLPGFGELDLFFSRNLDGAWAAPQNLGYPLNTAGFEGNIFVNAKGNLGFINSTREGGFGKSDIYSFELDSKIQPSFTTYVRGFVKEKGSGKPLPAEVLLINLSTRDTIRDVLTNSSTGKFLLTLPLDNDYAAYVQKKGYLFASRFFSLPRNPNQVKTEYFDLTIELEPIQKGVTSVLNNVFFASGSYQLEEKSRTELEVIFRFMKENPSVKVEIAGHTDNVGSDKDNQVLSENRASEVKKFLITKGIPADRIASKGYGELEPIADNATESGRATNRRTEFRILEVGK